jgi:hypothetical protein
VKVEPGTNTSTPTKSSLTMSYADGKDIASDLANFSKEHIIKAGAPIKFRRADCKSRQHLINTVTQLLPHDQERLCRTVRTIQESAHKRRKLAHDFPQEEDGVGLAHDSTSTFDNDDFLKPQSEDIVKQCIVNFIDRTGNVVLRTVICMVCAREMMLADTEDVAVDKIPHGQLLVPKESHSAHWYMDGLLLHCSAIRTTATGQEGAVCNKCMMHLRKNRLPKFALANGMWIGDVPFQLVVLTLPEQILIAKHFPALNIVKLFPQKRGALSYYVCVA